MNTTSTAPVGDDVRQAALRDFVAGYLEAAEFTTVLGESGAPLECMNDPPTWSPEARQQAVEECRDFLAGQWAAVEAAQEEYGVSYEQAGRDFWLTRNRHGAGFWDGDYPEPHAKALTDAAHAAGERDVVDGDNGRLYFFPGA